MYTCLNNKWFTFTGFEFYKNGIMLVVSLWDLLSFFSFKLVLLKDIHFMCSCTLFIFTAIKYSIVRIHHNLSFFYIWKGPSLPPITIVVNLVSVSWYICKSSSSSAFYMNLDVEIYSIMQSFKVCWTNWEPYCHWFTFPSTLALSDFLSFEKNLYFN